MRLGLFALHRIGLALPPPHPSRILAKEVPRGAELGSTKDPPSDPSSFIYKRGWRLPRIETAIYLRRIRVGSVIESVDPGPVTGPMEKGARSDPFLTHV